MMMMLPLIIFGACLLGLGILIALMGITIIKPNEGATLYSMKQYVRPIGSGVHFLWP